MKKKMEKSKSVNHRETPPWSTKKGATRKNLFKQKGRKKKAIIARIPGCHKALFFFLSLTWDV